MTSKTQPTHELFTESGFKKMLKKLLSILGLRLAGTTDARDHLLYKPYPSQATNFIYNLTFCDELGLFRSQARKDQDPLWSVLLADNLDKNAVRKIAEDQAHEGRVRVIAYNRLRAAGNVVPSKELFGVIVEAPFEQGLDVLAVFSEGGIRYINQSGKMAIFEGHGHPLEQPAKDLFHAAEPIVKMIGPWEKQRLAPPLVGNVRITFLVSDGLYFGEGPFGVMQKDQMAGPVLARAAKLLQLVVATGTSKANN
ncbi:MAG TPA: hypothetical protein VG962_11755 [Steroidobacteraceae bacterium]|nr:hypothetical protein [Steroidobacteraceae bacterium]